MHAQDVLLVKPKKFYSNPETSSSNSFQQLDPLGDSTSLALREFELLQKNLEDFGVVVNIFEATSKETPDAIFPNNWFSTFEDKLILYPMLATNRRLERRIDIINFLQKKYGPYQLIDLTGLETSNQFLEGTGSLIFDRDNKLVFCSLSPRATRPALTEMNKHISYEFLTFTSLDSASKPIYHTNVMMSLGAKVCVIAMDTIANPQEHKLIQEKLSKCYEHIINLSLDQLNHFAGNILLLQNKKGEKAWFMSEQAFDAYTEEQKKILKRDGEIILTPIPTIEALGGGSVRCMMAEIFPAK